MKNPMGKEPHANLIENIAELREELSHMKSNIKHLEEQRAELTEILWRGLFYTSENDWKVKERVLKWFGVRELVQDELEKFARKD